MKLNTIKLAIVLAASIPTVALAEDASGKSDGPRVIQGGVVTVDVTLNDIRDARLSVSRARKAAANLYDEVTREQVTWSTSPNLIGTTVISIPTPQFSGQYLPARRKWVKAAMAEITPIVTLLKEDVDIAIESNRQTEVSTQSKGALDSLKTSAFSEVNDAFSTFKQLESLTTASSFDNGSIASTVKTMDDQLKTLDKDLKQGQKLLQREAKAAAKSSKKVASKNVGFSL